MTRRAEIARLLAALLDDDEDIAIRPLEEVVADVETLDLDPERSVALADALARRPGSPATRLLATLADGDDSAGIDALASAPIHEVQATVPTRTRAAAAAPVQWQVCSAANVVGSGRRRLRVIGIGGALVGIAAAIALVVLTQRSPTVWPDLALTELPAASIGPEEQWLLGPAEPESAVASRAPAGAPPTALDDERALLADRPKSVLEAGSDEAEAELRSRQAQPDASLAPDRTAFLVIDPSLAPARWRSLSLPEGELEERLPAARRLAAGRRIVALAAHGPNENRRAVVIVVRRASGDIAGANGAVEGLSDALAPLPQAFEILPLD